MSHPNLADSIFAGIEIDRQAYAIVVKLIDGNEMRLNVRPLFEAYDHEKSGAAR